MPYFSLNFKKVAKFIKFTNYCPLQFLPFKIMAFVEFSLIFFQWWQDFIFTFQNNGQVSLYKSTYAILLKYESKSWPLICDFENLTTFFKFSEKYRHHSVIYSFLYYLWIVIIWFKPLVWNRLKVNLIYVLNSTVLSPYSLL